MPDKKGVWKVIAKGETEHGLHGAEVEVKVKDLKMKEGYYALMCFYKVKISDPKADYLWLITSLTWQR